MKEVPIFARGLLKSSAHKLFDEMPVAHKLFDEMPTVHKAFHKMPTRWVTKKIDERIQLKGLIPGDYHIDLVTSLAHDLSNIPILISGEDQLLVLIREGHA